MSSAPPSSNDTEPAIAASRRAFCLKACRVASFAALGPLTQACGGSPTAPGGPAAPALPLVNGSVASGTIVVALGGSPLATPGTAARLSSAAGELLVARTGQDSAIALTATCTHERCTITGFENNQYVCPCHGSRFTTSGGVVTGPATQSLRQFPATVNGDTLTITL